MTTGNILRYAISLVAIVAAVPVDQPPDNMTISILSENLEVGNNVEQRRDNLDHMAHNPLRKSVQDSGSIEWNEDGNLIDKSSTKIDTDVSAVSDVRLLRAGNSKHNTQSHPKRTRLSESQKRTRHRRNVKGQSEADSKPREGGADRQEHVETSTPPTHTPSQETVGRLTHETTTTTAASTQVLNNVDSSKFSVWNTSVANEMSFRNKRAECPKGPPGLDKCIPCTHERPDKYFHRDLGTGYICMCDTCTPTMYQVTPCRCTVNRKVAVQPTCTFAILGETYMPHPNSCSEPLVCTSTCPGNLIIVIKCTLDADAVCGCDVNMELTGPTTCTDKPRCGVGYQSVEVYNPANPNYPTYTCEACEDGHIQPFNNSLQKCYPRPSPPEKLVKSTETVPNGGEKGTIAPTVLPRDVLTNGLSTIPVKQNPSITQKIDSQVPHTDFPHDVLHGYKTAVIALIVILTVVLLLLAIAFICHVCKDKCRNADGQQNVIYNGRDVSFNGAHDNCDAV